MPVYLPTSAVGNGRVLATLGGAGEIMSFFYPRLDFSQNVQECMPALYVGDPGRGRLVWTFDAAFSKHQYYLPDTNIVRTELVLDHPSVAMTLTDFCPPKTTALFRTVRLENRGDERFHGSFGHYFDLRLGEVWGKQAVGYDPAAGHFLQYFRGIAIAVGGTAPDLWRCGKSLQYDHRSAKYDMADGHLEGQLEDIGRVDFAGFKHLDLAPGESLEFTLIIAAGSSREEAQEMERTLAAEGAQAALEATQSKWHKWLEQRISLHVPEDIDAAFRRALLATAILQDANTGSILAAPEFDPAYERCGGYGYCWPRDASEAAEALAEAGYPDVFDRLCAWYRTSQLPDGMWGQRHWADGQVAASWALRRGFEQIDETAAALASLCKQVLWAPQDRREAILEANWSHIQPAAQALCDRIGDDGMHRHACDLWETYCGVFLYTNASMAHALRCAVDCARLADEKKAADTWETTHQRIKRATLAMFNGTHFPRGLHQDGSLDDAVDSSSLGLCEPWGMLSADDAAEREMIIANFAEIRRRLTHDFGTARGLRRFEGDAYLGGVVGCVNTLWGAQISLILARSLAPTAPDTAREYRDLAAEYIRLCLSRATATGLLPELIGLQPDTPYWAAPHGWASALMVRCTLLWDTVDRLLGDTLQD